MLRHITLPPINAMKQCIFFNSMIHRTNIQKLITSVIKLGNFWTPYDVQLKSLFFSSDILSPVNYVIELRKIKPTHTIEP